MVKLRLSDWKPVETGLGTKSEAELKRYVAEVSIDTIEMRVSTLICQLTVILCFELAFYPILNSSNLLALLN